MSAAISQFRAEYARTFPTDLPTAVGQSFIGTAALTLLLGGSAEIVIVYGAVAATATLIEAVIRPLIAPFFIDKPFASMASLLAVSLMITSRLGDTALSFLQLSMRIEAQIMGGILGAFATIYINDGIEWYNKNRAFVVVM